MRGYMKGGRWVESVPMRKMVLPMLNSLESSEFIYTYIFQCTCMIPGKLQLTLINLNSSIIESQSICSSNRILCKYLST